MSLWRLTVCAAMSGFLVISLASVPGLAQDKKGKGNHRLNYEDFQKIQLGMSLAQVENIIGRPGKLYAVNDVKGIKANEYRYHWRHEKAEIKVGFIGGRASFKWEQHLPKGHKDKKDKKKG